jgi:hypothetical protein
LTCTITYPSSQGACSGANLITACGNWNRPTGSTTGTVRVFGRLYDPAATVDAKPPSDAVPASAVTENISTGTRSWHFNTNPLPGASIGSNKKLMVWITADDASCYEPATPQNFLCCDSASGGCPAAPCLGSFGTPPAAADAACAELTVIRTIAPRSYRLGLDDGVFALANATKSGAGFKFPPVVLDYSLEQSTSERAVWSGRGLVADVALILAVARTSCGGLCAELTLQRLTTRGVQPPLVWESIGFDLLKGGTFVSAQEAASSASVLVVRPERGAADKAVSQEAAPDHAEPQQAARGRSRRTAGQ